ncbi:ExbD/TolR family protein [Sphingobacterium bovistauri]|uniref:Biopolymer transporter ExbD n=1 Tax=Sphingobacterium bovistauri TaxID=2781959 RepID=A0ABS7Z8P9_9SPHI|nr:biopolymer transporter ExbD [Sphingobacterium bovistauri]MCA5006568.1 biopolymer transporter ExbD [Sphingobacterium bovistauri]
MAELNEKTNSSVNKKIRTRKVAPKVDLTAMVDLAFLLITFFMLTTSLNKPNTLDVAVPDKNMDRPVDMDEKRIVNLIIYENAYSIIYGNMSSPIQIIESIDTKRHSLKNHLIELNNKVKLNTADKNTIVIIKPTNDAFTKNIIDCFDEIRSAKIEHYMLSKLSAEEKLTLHL